MNTTEILQKFEALPFPVEVELGTLTATIGEIFGLKEGKVLQTNHPAGVPFKLLVGGIELASAEVVVVEKSVSARVNALVEMKKTTPESDGNS